MRVLALVLVWELMVLLVVALAMRMAMTMAMGMVIEVAPRRRPAAHTHTLVASGNEGGWCAQFGRMLTHTPSTLHAHSDTLRTPQKPQRRVNMHFELPPRVLPTHIIKIATVTVVVVG